MLPLTCWCIGTVLSLTGCGRYAEFTLPQQKGAAGATMRIELQPDPVIQRSTERDLLNPSVVRSGTGWMNLYSEFDGNTWRTALARSADGITWRKEGRVLAPDPGTWEKDYIAANGAALSVDGAYWYWYQAGDHDVPSIGLARSSDGRVWRKEPKPVIEPGPRGSWDERGVGDPYALKLGGEFYIYYLGQNRARQQQLGVARSEDGVHWTKLRTNPVLTVPWPGSGSVDENGLGEPAVWQGNGWYWMIFTGRNAKEQRSLIGARSRDGVHWARLGAARGAQAWNREVVCDPTVVVDGDQVRLWFGGGDKARPDENLDGQIGAGRVVMGTRP